MELGLPDPEYELGSATAFLCIFSIDLNIDKLSYHLDQPLPGSVLGDSIRIPSQLLKMKLRELFAKPKPVCVARPNKSVYQPAIFVYEQRIADLD